MPRAKRHYIPGQVWHITHRCHQRQFLLKFTKDKHCWIHWLFEAKRRYGATILNYTVTSNRIRLLVRDDKDRMTIPKTIQLVAGRCAQEYNTRKNRKGAFWEDRYHATAIESGNHLFRCMVYIDLNMVRAGVVQHPREWQFGGFNEIMIPKRKCRIISHDKLLKLFPCDSHESFVKQYNSVLAGELKNGKNSRQDKWSQSIAVGDRAFVNDIKAGLKARAVGRQVVETDREFTLREDQAAYNAHFDAEKSDIGGKNFYFWQ